MKAWPRSIRAPATNYSAAADEMMIRQRHSRHREAIERIFAAKPRRNESAVNQSSYARTRSAQIARALDDRRLDRGDRRRPHRLDGDRRGKQRRTALK